mmetsp:Transcript_13589/g.32268  ORF Transcript_13589/g.32268 Transcript_13589/m.32268 type:complete len:274 (-) Transcript_13589:136-957(-)
MSSARSSSSSVAWNPAGAGLWKGISTPKSISLRRFFPPRALVRAAPLSRPACFNSRRFCRSASRLASASIFSRAFRLAFLPCVLARRARASWSISISSSSMSMGSGRAGLVSGWVSISPGRRRRASDPPAASSPTPASPPALAAAASSRSRSYRSWHWAAVRPTSGPMVRHWAGISLARWRSFSSSALDHSTFRTDGSSHSFHRALHCLADLRFNREATRAHCCFPYFITAALRISSSEFFHTPPLMKTRTMVENLMSGLCKKKCVRAESKQK